jgi:lysophospholipid acyltransferase (LPLAT)-like uncharacterized protein
MNAVPEPREASGDSAEAGPGRPSSTERLKISVISAAGYWAIRFICSTLRWEVQGMQHHESILSAGKRVIYVFWHGGIFSATYFWRKRGIVVMTSQNRDGEYIARVILRFGYGAARGSSTRGSRRALVEMIRVLRQGKDAAFTIDGPRGPRHIAKPGAAYLAWKSGNFILPFTISLDKKWMLKSWDRFEIPKPFSRASVIIAPPIEVAADASELEIENAQREIQNSLDRLQNQGEAFWNPAPGGRQVPR